MCVFHSAAVSVCSKVCFQANLLSTMLVPDLTSVQISNVLNNANKELGNKACHACHFTSW